MSFGRRSGPISYATVNITASIQDSSGTTEYSAAEILGANPSADFVSALFNETWAQNTGEVVSFDTDCTAGATGGYETACTSPTALHTAKGWDNVTGVNVPNGKAFADSFYGK